MIGRFMLFLTRLRIAWLATCVVASVTILAAVGYRAIAEWQRSAALLAQRRVDAAADQLVTAITRDMRGVQASVLSALHVEEMKPTVLLDLNGVGSAFARYPYAELIRRVSGPSPMIMQRERSAQASSELQSARSMFEHDFP